MYICRSSELGIRWNTGYRSPNLRFNLLHRFEIGIGEVGSVLIKMKLPDEEELEVRK